MAESYRLFFPVDDFDFTARRYFDDDQMKGIRTDVDGGKVGRSRFFRDGHVELPVDRF
jgi:hypothetical protein